MIRIPSWAILTTLENAKSSTSGPKDYKLLGIEDLLNIDHEKGTHEDLAMEMMQNAMAQDITDDKISARLNDDTKFRIDRDTVIDPVSAKMLEHMGVSTLALMLLARSQPGWTLEIEDDEDKGDDPAVVNFAITMPETNGPTRVELNSEGPRWYADGGLLFLADEVPMTVANAAKGRRLRDVVRHVMLDELDERIISIERPRDGFGTAITLACRPIERKTRQMSGE